MITIISKKNKYKNKSKNWRRGKFWMILIISTNKKKIKKKTSRSLADLSLLNVQLCSFNKNVIRLL